MQEYPKYLHRASATGVEHLQVQNEPEEQKALSEGYIFDLGEAQKEAGSEGPNALHLLQKGVSDLHDRFTKLEHQIQDIVHRHENQAPVEPPAPPPVVEPEPVVETEPVADPVPVEEGHHEQ